MTLSILIVEDEKEIADTLVYALSSEHFEVDWASDCEAAKTKVRERDYSLAVLDIGLPDGNGFDLLKTIRSSAGYPKDLPVIFLTARNEEIDRIVGLEIGADDYVCKPFSPRELTARIKAILRRVNSGPLNHQLQREPTQATSKKSPNPFVHDPLKKTISIAGVALNLTRAEYVLLLHLTSQPGRVFSRRQLIEHVWSSNHPSDDRAIDTHIKTLRAKLRTLNPHQDFIVTHRGFGYSLEL